MKSSLTLLAFLSLYSFSLGQNMYFPPQSGPWDTLSPTSLNWCPDQIDSLYQFLEEEATKSFLLLKDGKVVLEKYFGNYTQDSIWPWFSAGKSLRAMLIGIAQQEGFLNIQDKSSDYLGMGWTNLPPDKEDSIRIWHQLTMTSGLNRLEFDCITPNCLTYAADAGTQWAYHNGPYSLLQFVLEDATGKNHNLYTHQKIKVPIGMGSGFWIASGNNNFFVSKARDMARFGILIQNRGIWDGDSLLQDQSYMEAMITPSQVLNPAYGYLWWLNGQVSFIEPSGAMGSGPIAPDAPMDVVTAAGAQGQFISFSDSLGLLMVRQGQSANSDNASLLLHNNIWKQIMHLACSTTAVEEFEEEVLQVYPNPVLDHLNIHSPYHEPISIDLFGMNGQLILSTQSLGSSIEIKGLPPGVYTLRLRQGERVAVRKLMKLK